MKLFVLIGLLFVTGAQAGSESVGGGDSCEKRIQEIRDDIKSWILAGGANGLEHLPVPTHEYSGLMLSILNTEVQADGSTRATTNIQCTNKPLLVDGIEKTCLFDSSESVPQISCHYERFLNQNLISAEEQYRLIHHEYAGLAGLENPSHSQSSYTISNQIALFLESQVTQKLVVKKRGEKLLMAGTEMHSGLECSVSLEEQNPAHQIYSVIYRAGKKTLRFYNQILPENRVIHSSGLFKKHGSEYETVIGSPIFPVGTYHHVTLSEGPDGYDVQTKIQVAAAIGSISISSQSDFCHK